MALTDFDHNVHTHRAARPLAGALIGAGIGLLAASLSLFANHASGWTFPVDVALGALAGTFMAVTSRW